MSVQRRLFSGLHEKPVGMSLKPPVRVSVLSAICVDGNWCRMVCFSLKKRDTLRNISYIERLDVCHDIASVGKGRRAVLLSSCRL